MDAPPNPPTGEPTTPGKTQIEIPPNLRNHDFRFIKIKARDKVPDQGKGWTKDNNHQFDDAELTDHIKNGGNYGVLGGYGGLAIIDCDTAELADVVKQKLPPTFTVKTGRGGTHFYYKCHDIASMRLFNGEHANIGDIQGQGKMVVGPGSIHPNGKRYRVTDDIPPNHVTENEVEKTLADYLPQKKEPEETPTETIGTDFDSMLRMDDVISLSNFSRSGDEYLGTHPIHGSGNKANPNKNLNVNTSKNLWHCWSCDTGGGPFKWIAVQEGIIKCDGELRGKDFINALKIAREKYGLKDKQPIKVGDATFNIPDSLIGNLKKKLLDLKDLKKAGAYFHRMSEIATKDELESYIRELESEGVDCAEIWEHVDLVKGIIKINCHENHSPPNINHKTLKMLEESIGEKDKGIVYLNQPIPLDEAEFYSKRIYRDTGKIVFPITPTKKITGKMFNREWRGRKTIPILFAFREKRNKDEIEVDKTTVFYNHYIDKRRVPVDVLKENYYGFRFWSDEENREYLILSDKDLPDDEDIEEIEGLWVEKVGIIEASGEVKLTSYDHIIHLTHFHPKKGGRAQVKYIHGGLRAKLPEVIKAYNLNPDELDNIDYKQQYNKQLFSIYHHPSWYSSIVFSWLFSGKYLGYPLHFFVFQRGGGGKTTLFERICKVIGISPTEIWSGNTNTIKSLIPNFGTSPPDCGWLSKQREVGLLDEFFGRKSNKNISQEMYEYDSLKDLFEHRRGVSSSGKGSVEVNVTAKFFCASNLKYGINDVPSFMERTDPALVERLLVYFMNEEHEKFIEENREDVTLGEEPRLVIPHDFLPALIKWAYTFTIDMKRVDTQRLKRLRKKYSAMECPDADKTSLIQDYANARLNHHIFLLLDGLVKYRCFGAGDFSGDYTPIEEDYVELETIMEILAHSWLNAFDIDQLSLDARVRMLRGLARELYLFLKSAGRLLENDVLSYGVDVLKADNKEVERSITQLTRWGVIVQNEGYYQTFWYDPDFGKQKQAEALEEAAARPSPQNLLAVLDREPDRKRWTREELLEASGWDVIQFNMAFEHLQQHGDIYMMKGDVRRRDG